MLLVGFFPCAGKFDLRWDDQISRRFIFWDWQPTICCGDCLAWLSLLEPAHSSESECTGWTNRRIVLTKYHTARALEKLIWFKTVLEKRLYWETMTRAEWNHAFTQDHTMKTKSEQVGCQSPWVFCTCIQYDPISTAQQNAKAFISMNIMLLHFVCPSEGYYYYYYYYGISFKGPLPCLFHLW